MTKLFIFSLMVGFVFQASGNGKNNGAVIEKYLESSRTKISLKDIEDLIVDNGAASKKEVLIPLFKRLLETSSLDLSSDLVYIKEQLVGEKERFYIKLETVHINLGDCPGSKVMCVLDVEDLEVTIDHNAIRQSAFGISYPEFIGGLGHEMLHLSSVSFLDHDKYPLLNHFVESVEKRNFKNFEFRIRDLIFEFRGKKYILEDRYQFNAHWFCRAKGFTKWAKFSLTTIWQGDAESLGLVTRDGKKKKYHKLNFDPRYPITDELFWTPSMEARGFFGEVEGIKTYEYIQCKM